MSQRRGFFGGAPVCLFATAIAVNCHSIAPGSRWKMDPQLHKAGDKASEPWSRVRVSDPMVAVIVRRALDEGSRRLVEPACQAILYEFHDPQGRPLAARLAALEVDIATYWNFVVFVDGWQNERCEDAIAFTVPGSRVVRICARAVLRTWRESADRLVFALIHEVLHTLGLSENPPSSEEITEKVRLACGPSW